MIINRKNEEQIPTDFLRLLYNRSLIYSINCFLIGKGQSGKSTGCFYMANRLKQIERGISLKKAKWNEWDYKKFTSNNPIKFVELWDKYEREIIVLEEVAEQMFYLDWHNIMARVFSSTTSTQGLKRNICFLITPYFDDLVKNARSKLDLVAIFHHRNDTRRTVVVTPKYVRLNWKTFKPEFKPIKNMNLQYTKRFLRKANEYTNWLKGFKKEISLKNKYLAEGFDPDKPISDKNQPLWIKKML